MGMVQRLLQNTMRGRFKMSMRTLVLVLLFTGMVRHAQAAQDSTTDNNTTGTSSRSEGPPYTSCDDQCQNQVKILEGFIAFLILGFALGVGVCCMKCIDTPGSSPLQVQQSASRAMSKKRE